MTNMESIKKILILGGNGFIGSHLVDALVENGYAVRIFDKPNTLFLGNTQTSKIETYYGDFSNEADLAAALIECDICFHLISTVIPASSNSDPIFDIETNLSASVKFLNQAVKSGLKKIIFLSSGGTVYGAPSQLPIEEDHPTNPLCSYGITKLAIEKYLYLYNQLHGLDYCILRLANPFGERQRTQNSQGAVAVFLGKALRNEIIEIWGDGSIVRDYIHISDAISAMLKAITYTGSERIFNIGSGKGININQLLETLTMVTGNTIKLTYKPARKFDVPTNLLSIERAKKVLNWQSKVSFIEGIRKMTQWLQQNNIQH